MDLMELIKERRNIKQFTNQPVDLQQIMTWLDAGSFAPNHRMVQPWEVLVVGPETRAKLNHKANFGDAPLVLAVLSKGADSAVDQEENLIATSCFVQNFLLLAWQNGVGARWTSIGSRPVAREILEVPEGYSVVGVFGVGHPLREVKQVDETGNKARTYLVGEDLVLKTQRLTRISPQTSLAKEVYFLNQIRADDRIRVPHVLGYGTDEGVEYTVPM